MEEKIFNIDSVVEEEIQVTSLKEAFQTATKAKAQEPKAQEPKAQEPKVQEPKVQEPKAQEPKAQESKAQEPKVLKTVSDFLASLEEPAKEKKIKETKMERIQAPQVQAPQVQAPQVQAPQVQAPQVQAPQIQAPQIQAPQVQAPQVQAPQVQAPVIKARYEIKGMVQGVVYLVFSGTRFISKFRVFCNTDAERISEERKNGNSVIPHFLVSIIEDGVPKIVEAKPSFYSSVYFHPDKPKPTVSVKVEEKEIFSEKKQQNVIIKSYIII